MEETKSGQKRYKLYPLLPDEAFKSSIDNDMKNLNLLNYGLAEKVDEKSKLLIARLLSIHGVGTIYFNRASNEIELRLPDPKLLKSDGNKELYSQHLYVNISKYINGKHKAPARCVKTGSIYSIHQLLAMQPLPDRKNELGWDPAYYLNRIKHKIVLPETLDANDESYKLENKDIISPGDLIPITQLPSNHPAVVYLNSRGYTNLKLIEDQFDCAFCCKENPQLKHIQVRDSAEKQLQFNPLLASSPQGKIIFFAKHFGVKVLWQARVIEYIIGDSRYFYQYYGEDDPRTGFVRVATKNPETNKYNVPIPPFTKSCVNRKYVIAPGGKASNCLLGFDAALEWNKQHKTVHKCIGIVEGALDAAKLGPPFCAIMGATMSHGQFVNIANTFDKIYYLCDHDLAGENLRQSIIQKSTMTGFNLEYEEILYPEIYKDVGEITNNQLLAEINSNLIKNNSLMGTENDLIIS